jgi:signal transduction histidine kinase
MALNRCSFSFQRNLPKIGIILVIFIIALAYGLYFLFQDTAENDIKEKLFEQERQQLLDANKAISQNIISDLDSILTKLKVIAVSPSIQEGEDTQAWDKSESLVQEMYDETKELVGRTDGMFVIDKSGIIRVNALTEEEQKRQNTFVGTNISHREYVNQAKTTHEPVFSTGLFSLDGVYRMFIAYPILNGETNEYMGLVSASIPTVDFFSRFGNVYNVQSQYLIALDRNANYLTHGNRELVGTNFLEETTQNSSTSSAALNGLVNRVLSSESGYTVYNSAEGERLATAYPVSVYGERPPSYAVLITTTTSQIYSQIENILLGQRIETFALLGIITVAVIIFTAFLFKWNSSLKAEVQRRTKELNESNRYLSEANERLEVNDKMQKEFINIAAHELRTPIMPIMGVTDLIKERFEEADQNSNNNININTNNNTNNNKKYDNHELTITKEELGMIVRNCERLQHLAEDVLTTARIESKSLRLQKERFNLNQAVQEVLSDLEINVQDSYNIGRNNLQLLYEAEGSTAGASNNNNKNDDRVDNNIVVNADKHMILQVISNLVNNAINFTSSGTISVEVERTMASNHISNYSNDYNNDDNIKNYNKPEALVKIKDTGSGIDAEILPRLFSKFATKSDHKGTGLGLFISKSIVEAHGGRIWAENNTDGRGATFAFSIPIDKQNNE